MEQQDGRVPGTVLPSRRLIASYALDWVVIACFAAIGGGIKSIGTIHRPFSLLDLSISYPLAEQSISSTTVGLVAILGPIVLMSLTIAIFVPARSISRTLKRSELLRLKLWELHASLAGLALSITLAFMVTQGLKTIFPKPRPHFLALCDPDLDNIAAHVVGGYGQDVSDRWTMVDVSICQHPMHRVLRSGLQSFPSGHSSMSWSGMAYLSLFLCARLRIAIPHLPLQSTIAHRPVSSASGTELLPLHNAQRSETSSDSKPSTISSIQRQGHPQSTIPINRQSAAPPTYGILIALIPLAVATYISSTRYTEYWHFGIDILTGSVIGILSSWLAFRWHHLPIRRGHGWAWGPRSAEGAFGVGMGVH
ncbi:uncharacterized protein LTR77_009934 [Saxophila tyrrhenica]|uniref:Phosphatidic acid phosphatase type 2/haloperoxidase domain-containing protein n=1 Tax=Saxophila tyrrhenica TaxID=1690608 RepID=A0AAV9NZ25_9PEZI|nr:hypothetical protein LTR77_009934 [Saxophila tyrrhenica]